MSPEEVAVRARGLDRIAQNFEFSWTADFVEDVLVATSRYPLEVFELAVGAVNRGERPKGVIGAIVAAAESVMRDRTMRENGRPQLVADKADPAWVREHVGSIAARLAQRMGRHERGQAEREADVEEAKRNLERLKRLRGKE